MRLFFFFFFTHFRLIYGVKNNTHYNGGKFFKWSNQNVCHVHHTKIIQNSLLPPPHLGLRMMGNIIMVL